ncbi:MAG: CDP-alcohol phosphatidyltransferase family protein [Duncaniella sp.]|nr:CDP-alcohol phosphatidyltransferase family protein [Duncaniella sp.]HBI58386.1 CDP-alcohol phosphatidyltransferase [Porphyromonadaceae bacterium]
MAESTASTTSSYRDSLKSMDTEEHIDLFFYRPIGYAWACLARKLGVTPNAITIASIFLGIGAGVMFYFNSLWMNVIGMLLLIWANSFDSADGQLARMTKQYSRLGRILDGLSGDVWFACIYVAICLRENVTSAFFMEHPWVIWVVAVVTGICHAKQAAMADYYRQFHLYFLKGEDGSELEKASDLKTKLATLSWSRDFWKKLTLTFYTNYTVQQEATAPAMQALRRELQQRFPSGRIPQSFRDAFRTASLPLMKYTNILSFNWRTIALFISLFLKMPWLYFAFELVVLNNLLVYMVIRHEAICRKFTAELKDGKY